MKYTKIEPAKLKDMAEDDIAKALSDNDLAQKETEEALATAEGKVKTLEEENEKLRKNQKEPEEKTAKELIKELF